ncbi:spore protease YyaC [Bacillus sp. 3255]|uniref:spore protease YyaC n=1 Tax=Bacillus sp. 3255 TaxID=2817904 RepID=UPI0028546228|nr:spore protease YyaC [Bacillus sp. 3255]MDR6883067.1 putative sporulation protein YyaC [Bacillus sp. 3255]
MNLNELLPKELNATDVTFVCIGTDRSTGDSLGPLVGTFLSDLGYDVIGTLENPAHGMNLNERLEELKPNKTVIAIDSGLGLVTSVGKIKYQRGSIQPGSGVNREDLPKVGDYHLMGIVNVGGFMEYYVLANTRLSLVMRMAKEMVQEIKVVLPLTASFHEVASGKEREVNQCLKQ